MAVAQRFYIETLGCPKNQVDSDKLIGTLLADGLVATDDAAAADLVVPPVRRVVNESLEAMAIPPLRQELRIEPGAPLVDGAPSWTLFDPRTSAARWKIVDVPL